MVLHGKNLYSIFAVSNHISMATAIKAIPTLRGKEAQEFLRSAAETDAITKGLEAFYALREEARKNGLQDMTLEEINEEIRLARAERDAKTR